MKSRLELEMELLEKRKLFQKSLSSEQQKLRKEIIELRQSIAVNSWKVNKGGDSYGR